MQKKVLFLLLLLMTNTAPIFAQTALVVKQKSGGSVYYSFDDNPKVVFSGENVVVSTNKKVVEYPIDSLSSFSFGDMSDGVLDINANGANVKLTDNMIVVTGLSVGEVVDLYDVKGMKIAAATASNGFATISLHNLPNGVYIVKSQNVTYKIIKK